MSRPVYINGKFLAQELTGVQRVGHELLRALDQELAERPSARRWELLLPPGAAVPVWPRLAPRALPGSARLTLWEQWSLGRVGRDGLLLNLSGSAPWLAAPRAAAMLHDAAVFDHPRAYRPIFVAWYRQLFRRLGRRAPLLLSPSAFSAARLGLALDQPSARWRVLTLGADHLQRVAAEPGLLNRLGLTGEDYLLAVGSLNPSKNLARLCRAFLALRRPGLRLVLVGGRHDAVFARAAGLPDDPSLVWAGRVDDAALKALYQGALGLAFPSLVEGFGLPPLEAMDCGCPVLAAPRGALPEVLGEAALWVEPEDEDALCGGLARLLDQAALREQLRAAGRERAARYRWAEAARRLRDWVEEVAG